LIESHRGTYDVGDGVPSANLVKVHVLNRYAMDMGLRFSNGLEDSQCTHTNSLIESTV
jgi:hypothetical protein